MCDGPHAFADLPVWSIEYPYDTLPSLIGKRVVPIAEKMTDRQNSLACTRSQFGVPPGHISRKNSPFCLDWLEPSLDTDEEMSMMPIVSRLLSCIVCAACPLALITGTFRNSDFVCDQVRLNRSGGVSRVLLQLIGAECIW